MLRTRRKDNNVKPNRRLDRKSSRGMLYENEELRLKTININAEIERGQSDIKKLKRENEMLKKEIWCLRDEYEKLDKILNKDKKIDFSSSSTTYSSSSDSESCSSCTEDTEEVETSQNLKNVQKTNLKNIKDQFDHLSIVTEETSCEISDEKAHRNSMPIDEVSWNNYNCDVIKADQSYPIYGNILDNLARSQTVPNHLENLNFFSPIKSSKSFDDFDQIKPDQTAIFPGEFYQSPMTACQKNVVDSISDQTTPPPLAISPNTPAFEPDMPLFPTEDHFLSKKIVRTNANNFYQNMVLVPKNPNPPLETRGIDKRATDLIVKIDNKNFNSNTGLTYSNTTPSTTFSNGGNLEELLHDIDSISQEILKLTDFQRGLQSIPEPNYYPENQNFYDLPHDGNISQIDDNISQIDGNIRRIDGNLGRYSSSNALYDSNIRRCDSNPRLGVGNLGRSNSSLRKNEERTESQEKLHKSELNVVLMPKAMPLIGLEKYKNIQRSFESIDSQHLEHLSVSQQNLTIIPPNISRNSVLSEIPSTTPLIATDNQETNPFFFGNFTDNYVSGDYFHKRYIPANLEQNPEKPAPPKPENEENLQLRISKTSDSTEKCAKQDESPSKTKPPKMSITKKVSIHFKGKKEKDRLKKAAQDKLDAKSSPKKLKEDTKKSSLFDIRFLSDSVKEKSSPQKESINPSVLSKQKSLIEKVKHQKTPSLESKKSTTETSNGDPKTPNGTSTDSTSEKKKDTEKNDKSGSEKKSGEENGEKKKEGDKKSRKSSSVSPDRAKHVHVIHDVGYSKKHKKHRNKDRSGRSRRASIDQRLRERSYSICTDRSALESRLGLGLGLGLGGFIYDDFSDRERTNSGSSMDSNNSPSGRLQQRRRLSVSGVPMNGKLPWCGCWGNGCV